MIFKTSKENAKRIIEILRKEPDLMVMDDPEVYIATPLENITTDNVQLAYDDTLHRIFMYADNYKLNPASKITDDENVFINTAKEGFLPEWAKNKI